jgi:crotonobetainyl-CoA:carnitine CoA-transferase CaiB-like acyl-CoA transferase
MSVTGTPDGPPVKCGVPVSDFATGLYAAFSVASALRQAEASGEGVHIDVSMLGSSLAIAALQTSEYFGSGKNPRKLGSAHPRNAPYQVFRCRDGYFGMAAGNNMLWSNVCHAIGRTELLSDHRFGSPSDRAKNQSELLLILEDIFQHEGSEHWLDVFRTAGVPCAPINSYSEILADPQVQHMEWIQELDLPNGQRTRSFMSPIRLNGQTQQARMRPPALGEHNAELKASLAARELQGE